MVAGEDRKRMSPVQSQEYRHAQYVPHLYGTVGLAKKIRLLIKTLLIIFRITHNLSGIKNMPL
jgi:hypothetical protein